MAEIEPKVITVENGTDKPNHWFSAIISLYRLRVAMLLVAVGLLLFMTQMLTVSETVRPDSMLSWMVVYDFAEYNTAVAAREKEAEQAKAAGKEEPKAELPPLPRTDGQYFGAPAKGFAERFAAFTDSIQAPDTVHLLPVKIEQTPGVRVVPAGQPLKAAASVLDETFYYRLTLSPADAALLLRQPLSGSTPAIGETFLGPFPFDSNPAAHELVPDNGNRRALRQLPASASALQGMIIAVAEKPEANALLLLPTGDQTAGDFAHAVNGFYNDLSQKMSAQMEKSGARPEIVPTLGFSDYRHGFFVWLIASLGECLFLIGGFLLIYHFLQRFADREPKEGRPLGQWLIGSCRLIRDQRKIYALTVALFMLFWAFGTVNSYFDPGGQAKMVQVFSNQLAGTSWPLGFAGRAYAGGNVLEAALATFVVNFFWGTVVVLSVFSLIPIGTAFIINAFRGQVIGLVLAPTKVFFGQALVPHLITMVIELQGYLIAGFVAVLLPLALFKPERMGFENRLQAFKAMALWQVKVLPLIAIILAIAAAYEAVEIIVLRMLF